MNRATRSKLAQYARHMRRHMPLSEKLLWNRFLRTYPMHFSPQILVGPYIVDFYCRKVKLSIELDGSQHYEENQMLYDEIRTTYLEMEGIKEMRFPNSDIYENFEGVCEAIHQEVEKRRNDLWTLSLEGLKNKH